MASQHRAGREEAPWVRLGLGWWQAALSELFPPVFCLACPGLDEETLAAVATAGPQAPQKAAGTPLGRARGRNARVGG